MKLTIRRAAALLALSGMPAFAHRLDEYLQATLFSIEKNRVQAEMTLTPGVAVFPGLIARIDTNADGVISEAEQQAYARQVLRDLSLRIDGRTIEPRLRFLRFPSIDEMRQGRGQVQLDFSAEVPFGGGIRQLVFENRHLTGISAFQVNCLVPGDPSLRIAVQDRDYSQSLYRVEYEQTAVAPGSLLSRLWPRPSDWLFGIGVILFTSGAFLAVSLRKRFAGLFFAR